MHAIIVRRKKAPFCVWKQTLIDVESSVFSKVTARQGKNRILSVVDPWTRWLRFKRIICRCCCLDFFSNVTLLADSDQRHNLYNAKLSFFSQWRWCLSQCLSFMQALSLMIDVCTLRNLAPSCFPLCLSPTVATRKGWKWKKFHAV